MIVLETVAAVAEAMFTHLKCLRWMRDDEGCIWTLMEEAENERMPLMTSTESAKLTLLERSVICSCQCTATFGRDRVWLGNETLAPRKLSCPSF